LILSLEGSFDEMEKRLLLAFVLSAAIFALWSVLFPPPRPPVRSPVTATEEPTPATESSVDESEERPAVGEETTAVDDEQQVVEEETIEAEFQESYVLENNVLRLEISNRGAGIQSLLLKDYVDDEEQPLEIVQTVDLADRALPLQLLLDGEIDERIYVAEPIENGYVFQWANGRGEAIEKTISLRPFGYGTDVEVRYRGERETIALAVGTGMRNRSEQERKNRFSLWGHGVVSQAEELEKYKREKVGERVELQGQNVAFAGFEDTYFLSIFRPSAALAFIEIEPLVSAPTSSDEDEDEDERKVLRIACGSSDQEIRGELLTIPKEYDLLQSVGSGVEDTLHFQIFHPISVFFLKILRWIYGKVGNYGLAIILLTFCIRVLLFPLMHKSTVSMRRMQKLQPKLKAIQEKYRKNKTDPQVRAKMQQETMALYRQEGVNPVGGCLPLLVQLPILFALYSLFARAIELRHAPFMLWITDLSYKDPLLITPILMTATMWLQQRLAPQAGDPQQQRIFRLMPLIFGIMFLQFPSGLVLYWLTNNVLTIIQQEVTLHLIGERKRGGKSKPSARSKKK
jgi:YidC/Oxa1 family membrane protein insertase